jgi:hypothetical protein
MRVTDLAIYGAPQALIDVWAELNARAGVGERHPKPG